MARQHIISYGSKGKDYTVVKELPDTIEQAVAMYGGKIVYEKFMAKIKAEARSMAQRVGQHKAQEIIDRWQVGRSMNKKYGNVSAAELTTMIEKHASVSDVERFVEKLKSRPVGLDTE